MVGDQADKIYRKIYFVGGRCELHLWCNIQRDDIMTTDNGDNNPASKAVKISIPLPSSVHEALKREASTIPRDLTEHIQRILAVHVIKGKMIDQVEADRLQLFWSLVERAVEIAQKICRDGGFSSAITLNAIKACVEDEKWAADYKKVVQDDIYKHGNPHKGPINREIGWQIRAGIGGKVITGPNGKAATVKVLGEIIQSYTPMESFDPEAVRIKNSVPVA
jgi:hypothetical protein